MSAEVLEKKHVVIIGGGYGGLHLATKLKESRIPFTLIDQKDYFHNKTAAPRGVVDPEFLPKIHIDFKKTFGDNFIQSKVASVDFASTSVILENKHVIQYSDVVFAVGSDGPYPGRPNQLSVNRQLQECISMGEEIGKASRVVIVGGGAVGVEMAGEIVDRYPNVHVTIIHSRDHLVTMKFGEKFQSDVQDILEHRGIHFILSDKVTNLGTLVDCKHVKQTVHTEKGQKLEADVVIKCTGLGPNTALTRKVFGSNKLDENGRVKVNDKLEVEGFESGNVYAIGDCCNTNEEKMATYAGTHGDTVAKNLLLELQGKEKLPYKPAFTGMLLTIGKKNGAGCVNGLNWPWSKVGAVKGESLFTNKYWTLMGQDVKTP